MHGPQDHHRRRPQGWHCQNQHCHQPDAWWCAGGRVLLIDADPAGIATNLDARDDVALLVDGSVIAFMELDALP